MTERLFHVAAAPFEAARRVSILPEGHRSRRLHGHGFEVILHADQDLGAGDMGVDFDHLGAIWAPLHHELDHACLNDLPRLDETDPASLALWMREEITGQLPQLERIDLHETPGCGAVLCWGDLGPALPT